MGICFCFFRSYPVVQVEQVAYRAITQEDSKCILAFLLLFFFGSGSHFLGFLDLCSQAQNLLRLSSRRPGANSLTNRRTSSGKPASDSSKQASVCGHSSTQKPRVFQLLKQAGLMPLSLCIFFDLQTEASQKPDATKSLRCRKCLDGSLLLSPFLRLTLSFLVVIRKLSEWKYSRQNRRPTSFLSRRVLK